MSTIQLLGPFILYLFLLIGIGFYSYKYTDDAEGFLLGGRKLHPWVAGVSVTFSGSSGWMFMGAAGLAYVMGPSAFYMLLGNLIAMIFVYFSVPKRLRNYSGILGAITYPQFFEKRVRDNTKLIKIIASAAVIVFMSAYVAAQYTSAVKGITSIFGLTPLNALLITFVVVTLYCILGGFMAVSITDYVQGWVIIVGSIILNILLIVKAGGFGGLLTKLHAIDPSLLTATMGGKSGAVLVGMIFYYFSTAVSAYGRPHDTIRFFAIRNSQDSREMAMAGHLALLLNYWTSFLIGYAGRAFFPNLADPETIFPTILVELVNPWIAGIMLMALMALIMSTIDSQLMSAASSLSEDIYHGFLDKKASQKRLVLVSRISIILISAIGAIVSYRSSTSVLWLTLFASGGLAASFGPALVLSLYWKRLTKWGVISAMLSGFITVIIWYNTSYNTIIHEAAVGWIVAIIVGVCVSLLTQAPDKKEIEEEFEIIKKEYTAEEQALVENTFIKSRKKDNLDLCQ